jgi:hypothetical protein
MKEYVIGNFYLYQNHIFKVLNNSKFSDTYGTRIIEIEEYNKYFFIGDFCVTSYVDKNSFELGKNEELIKALYV